MTAELHLYDDTCSCERCVAFFGEHPLTVENRQESDDYLVACNRDTWIAYIVQSIRKGGRHDLTPGDLYLAHVFTEGHFDYKDGRQWKHDTSVYTYLANRAGRSRSNVRDFMKKIHKAGLAQRITGTERRMVAAGENPNTTKGKPTYLHQLRAPGWFVKGNQLPIKLLM